MWDGLTLAHTRGHLFRATLEAVAFGGRAVLDTLSEAGVPTQELVAVGGATRSDLWMQIHADVFGKPILSLVESDPVTLGAAMCAAVGIDAYPDLRAAAAAMSRTGSAWYPDAGRNECYQPLYQRYMRRLAFNAMEQSSQDRQLNNARRGAIPWTK
jgi:ribulose kinase